MNVYSSIKLILCFAIGSLVGFGVARHGSKELSLQHHQNVVKKYVSYMRDAANSERDGDSGLIATDPPSEPMVSLAALVAAGDLIHLDLVFPEVPQSEGPLRYWQSCVTKYDDIVFAQGNPSSIAFKPEGKQPLHLNIWFRESESANVQKLIRDLDEQWGKGVTH